MLSAFILSLRVSDGYLRGFGECRWLKRSLQFPVLFLNFYRTQRNSACMIWTSVSARALVTKLFSYIAYTRQCTEKKANYVLSFFLEGHFSVENSSLNLWEASIGSSYMCNKEQTFNITDTLSIHTFSLHVQPFGVNKGVFSTGRLFLKSPGVQTVALIMIRIRQEIFFNGFISAG